MPLAIVLTAVAVIFSASILFPLELILWAPIILGPAHVLSDFAVFIVYPKMWQRGFVFGIVGVTLILAAWKVSLTVAMTAGIITALLVSGDWRRRLVWVVFFCTTIVWIQQDLERATLIFAIAHNIIAFAFWYRLATPGKRKKIFSVVYMALSLIFLLVIFPADYIHAISGRALGDLAEKMFPVHSAGFGIRILYFYLFTQMMHYLLWFELIPGELPLRANEKKSWGCVRMLKMVRLPVVAITLVITGVMVFISQEHDPWGVRDLYLRWAAIHGYLEISGIVFWDMEDLSAAKMGHSLSRHSAA